MAVAVSVDGLVCSAADDDKFLTALHMKFDNYIWLRDPPRDSQF